MPLYEYQCPKDGTFELVRKFADPPLEACPTSVSYTHLTLPTKRIV